MSDIGRIINGKDGTDRGQIYQGDSTSHGGVVIGASGHQMKADGKVNARLGDQTFCPKCSPHFFPITTADPTAIDYGVPVPRHGDLTACGATLLARAAPPETMRSTSALVDAENHPYNEQFQLVDQAAAPLAGIAYYIERADGVSFFGYTDAAGKCPRIGSTQSTELKGWFGSAALLKQFGED